MIAVSLGLNRLSLERHENEASAFDRRSRPSPGASSRVASAGVAGSTTVASGGPAMILSRGAGSMAATGSPAMSG